MDASSLYLKNEEHSADINLVRFQQFIDDFYQAIGFNLDRLVTSDIHSDDPSEKFYYIRYLVSTYLKKYREEFYRVLELSGYNLQSEMIDVMKLLGEQTNLKYARDVVEYVLENPLIDAVETDGPKIIVKSDKLGDQAFYSARAYLSDNIPARTILMGNLNHKCHQISVELLSELKNALIVTSLMPSYFEGTYYHSYVKDNGMTIDAVNHIVMPHENYDKLFEPTIITELNKEELYKEYIDAISSGVVKQEDGFYMPVAVALSKQLRLGGK